MGAGEVTCLSRRARPLTDPCVPGSCEPGESCVELEGATACRPVCRMAEDDCPAPSQCAYQLDAESPYGLCSPACTLGQPCADGQTCTATARLDHLICGAVGPGGPGEPCDGGARCAADLACLVDVDGAARCRQLCAPAADACRQGACLGRIRQVAGVGFCTGG
ncbi:MAG: hypothetical protein KC613_27220 [Myxococcales bacterium]|nr:hypothetical protein [Myxococcales bacterium]